MTFEKGNTLGRKFQAGKEQAEIARQGGIASGEERRKIRDIKSAVQALMNGEHETKQGTRLTGWEIYATDLWNIANNTKEKPEVRLKAKKLLAELIDQYKTKLEIGNDGQPFEIKTIKVKEGMEKKINDYLNGSGLDGQGVQ